MLSSSAARWLGRTATGSSRRSALGGATTTTSTSRIFSTAPVVDEDDDSNNNKASTTPWTTPEELPIEGEWAGCRRNFMAPIKIKARGSDILQDPLFNKGTAFKSGERDRLRFRGLLPHRIVNIHKQKKRVLRSLRQLDSNIRKNLLLEDLHDRNETLYHRILVGTSALYSSTVTLFLKK